MGTWGVGSFSNDIAMDWLVDWHESQGSLMDHVMAELDSVGEQIGDKGSKAQLDVDTACRLIAAAETVAIGLGRILPDAPPEIVDAFANTISDPYDYAVSGVQHYLPLVLHSELAELWAEAAEDGGAENWPAEIAKLMVRTDPNAAWPPPNDELTGDKPICFFCNKPIPDNVRHRLDLYDDTKIKPELRAMVSCHAQCFDGEIHPSRLKT